VYFASNYSYTEDPLVSLRGHSFEHAEASYQSTCSSLVCALSSDLKGDIVWGVALDLKSCGREVVEILVEQLEKGRVSY
jgi:hypothetical protein